MEERSFDVSHLEYDFCDPEVSKVVGDIAFTNQYFSEVLVGEDEAEELVGGLSTELKEKDLIDRPVYITSHGWLSARDDLDDYGNAILRDSAKMEFQDQEVILSELVLYGETEMDDYGVTSKYHLYLYGRTVIEEEDGDNLDGFPNFEECVIDITPGTIIRSDGVTPARAEQWLTLHYPDEIIEITNRCIEADTSADALMNLRNYTLSTKNCHSDEIVELGKYIDAFLQHTLELEQHLPYVVTVEGPADVFIPKEFTFQQVELQKGDVQRFAYLYEALSVFDSAAEEYVLWVRGAVVSRDGRQIIPCRMPLTTLQSVATITQLAQPE